jgi:hypothetical protein
MRRFVDREEIKKKLDEAEYAVEFYAILLEAIDSGKFVMFDDEETTYQIMTPGIPIIE